MRCGGRGRIVGGGRRDERAQAHPDRGAGRGQSGGAARDAAEALAAAGHEVARAVDAGGALEAIGRSPRRPDLVVVTAVVEPEGRGDGLLRRVRALPGPAPVPVLLLLGAGPLASSLLAFGGTAGLAELDGRGYAPDAVMSYPCAPGELLRAMALLPGGGGPAPAVDGAAG